MDCLPSAPGPHLLQGPLLRSTTPRSGAAAACGQGGWVLRRIQGILIRICIEIRYAGDLFEPGEPQGCAAVRASERVQVAMLRRLKPDWQAGPTPGSRRAMAAAPLPAPGQAETVAAEVAEPSPVFSGSAISYLGRTRRSHRTGASAEEGRARPGAREGSGACARRASGVAVPGLSRSREAPDREAVRDHPRIAQGTSPAESLRRGGTDIRRLPFSLRQARPPRPRPRASRRPAHGPPDRASTPRRG